jgi:hypothetical protein
MRQYRLTSVCCGRVYLILVLFIFYFAMLLVIYFMIRFYAYYIVRCLLRELYHNTSMTDTAIAEVSVFVILLLCRILVNKCFSFFFLSFFH